MTHELAPWLLRLTLFTSLALLSTLALRRPARRLFGARLAYHVWLMVPLVTIMAWLPTRTAPHVQQVVALRKGRLLSLHMAPSPGFDVMMWCWAAGALALACWFIYAHDAFRRAAGVLQPADGVLISSSDCGPASVGLFHPVIVVPRDFTAQYSTAEQALIIAHERVHIVRGDAFANLLQAVFQCVFWFNPLIHIAALSFRRDQELACEAVVMAQHPGQRRTYVEALLKSHTAGAWQHSPINSHWQTHHPPRSVSCNCNPFHPAPPGALPVVCSLAWWQPAPSSARLPRARSSPPRRMPLR